jgi:hypothetical protein
MIINILNIQWLKKHFIEFYKSFLYILIVDCMLFYQINVTTVIYYHKYFAILSRVSSIIELMCYLNPNENLSIIIKSG